MIILPLGLVGVFPTVYKTQRKIRKISPFIEGEKRLSLDTNIFNTCVMFHLLTNTSKENKEISPFLEGGKKRLSLDTKIFNTCNTVHLLTNFSMENKEILPFLEGEKRDFLSTPRFSTLAVPSTC